MGRVLSIGHPRACAAGPRHYRACAQSQRRTHRAAPAGFFPRVVQHENDHLDGILFFDRMRSFGSLTFLDEYARFWAKD
jgi:peptide deformylase